MAGLVEFYLTSIWVYRDAGVERIVRQLRSHEIPDTDYTFDPDSNWFKVICRENDVRRIQATFQKSQSDIEADVDIKDLNDGDGRLRTDIVENKWIKAIQDQLLSLGPSETSNGYRCPATFDRYPARRVWSRIEDEAEPGVTLGSLLRDGGLSGITQSSGAFVSHSLCQRIVYIGAGSQSAVDCIVGKLNTLFDYSRMKPPYASHLLYGEAASSYTVDARYMAHINPNLVTSTTFDPGQLWATDLEAQYRALYSSVSLRICLPDAFKGACMSLFGPRAAPCFSSGPRWWSSLFRKLDYAPKARDDTNISTPSRRGGRRLEAIDKMDHVATWVAGIKGASSTLSGGTGQASGTITPAAAPGPDAGECPRPAVMREFGCSTTGAPCPVPERASIHNSAGDSLAADSPRETRGTLEDVARLAAVPTEEKIEPDTPLENPSSHPLQQPSQPRGNNMLSTAGLPVVTTPTNPTYRVSQPMSPLSLNIPQGRGQGGDSLDDEPASSGTASRISLDMKPLAPASLPRRKKATRQKKIVQDPQTREDLGAKFLTDIHANLLRLAGVMRVKVGTVQLRAELGRICLMDPVPGGLAFNTIEEAANGWNPTTLTSKLNAGCNSTNSVAFTRIISTIGNDADYLASQTNNIGDRMWSLVDTRVWYDFTCRRTIVDVAGRPKGYNEFVVEIEGSQPDKFSYKLRQRKEETHILWVHCLQRHWDVRFVLAHVPRARLEASYGKFARALLCSLVVPPGPKQMPRLRFDCDTSTREDKGVRWNDDIIALRARHVARHVGHDGATYLDITHVRDLRLVYPTQGEGQVTASIEATPAESNVSQGKFASWYEASVTSARGEQLFAGNEAMSLGEEAAWTPEDLDRNGVFQAIYGPALAMVKTMDGVGVMVNNGQDRRMEHPPRTAAVVEAKRATKGDKYLFW